MLAEVVATDISEVRNSVDFKKSKVVAKEVAQKAKLPIKPFLGKQNHLLIK